MVGAAFRTDHIDAEFPEEDGISWDRAGEVMAQGRQVAFVPD